MRVTATHLLVADSVAHLAAGTAVLAAPQVWRALALPSVTRVPIGVALLGAGAWHGLSVLRAAPSPALRVSAGLNAGWTAAALVAQGFPHTVRQRTALGLFATWHGVMSPLKLALPHH